MAAIEAVGIEKCSAAAAAVLAVKKFRREIVIGDVRVEFQSEDPGLGILALSQIAGTIVCLALATRAAIQNIVRF